MGDDLGGLVAQLLIAFARLVDGLFDLDLGIHRLLRRSPEEGLDVTPETLQETHVDPSPGFVWNHPDCRGRPDRAARAQPRRRPPRTRPPVPRRGVEERCDDDLREERDADRLVPSSPPNPPGAPPERCDDERPAAYAIPSWSSVSIIEEPDPYELRRVVRRAGDGRGRFDVSMGPVRSAVGCGSIERGSGRSGKSVPSRIASAVSSCQMATSSRLDRSMRSAGVCAVARASDTSRYVAPASL